VLKQFKGDMQRYLTKLTESYFQLVAKCKQTSGAHLKDDFLTNCLFCDIPQYSNVFYYIKHKRRAVYFNNQKNVAFDL